MPTFKFCLLPKRNISIEFNKCGQRLTGVKICKRYCKVVVDSNLQVCVVFSKSL